jgi:hypothetical protein
LYESAAIPRPLCEQQDFTAADRYLAQEKRPRWEAVQRVPDREFAGKANLKRE